VEKAAIIDLRSLEKGATVSE